MLNYHIEDFTKDHYSEILDVLLDQKRSFLSFGMANGNLENSVLVRHDIDLDL